MLNLKLIMFTGSCLNVLMVSFLMVKLWIIIMMSKLTTDWLIFNSCLRNKKNKKYYSRKDISFTKKKIKDQLNQSINLQMKFYFSIVSIQLVNINL